MNLRILKKLSERAAPLLPLLGDKRQQFRAEKDDNYGVPLIADRKYWKRSRCRPDHKPRNDYSIPQGAERVVVTRSGRHVLLQPPYHPGKGTVMVGASEGYEEPEWEETTAWVALSDILFSHFTDWASCGRWDGEGEMPVPNLTRSLRTPREIFQAARDMIADLHNDKAMEV
jgi:hypothetical protein